MKTLVSDRKRLFYLVLLMALVALIVGVVTVSILYNTAMNQQSARLVEITESQARLIEAIAHNEDANFSSQEAFNHTLDQVREAHENYAGFGETGEFTLARREGDQIVFLLSHRHFDLNNPLPIPFDSRLAEPQRRALSGQSGTMVGLDYRGKVVLAAYEPVAVFNLGIVAKIDLAEIRAPFYRAGFFAVLLAIFIIALGAIAFLRISNPVITHLEESVEALRVSEERFQNTLKSSPITVFNHDTKLRYTWIYNPPPSIVPAETVGKTDADLFPNGDGVHLMAIKRAVLESGQAAHEEVSVLIDGLPHYYDLQVELLTDREGNCTGLTCIAWDITKRKLAEQSLQESEERFKLIIQQSPAVFELYGLDGLQLDVNKAYEQLWGFPASHTVGKFNVLKSEEVVHTGLIDYVKRAYAGEKVTVPEYYYDPRGSTEARGEGRPRWLSTRIYPLQNKNGQVTNIVITHEDVTDRHQVEDAIRKLNEELEQRVVERTAQLESFSYSVSHDLRAPLRSISGFSQILLDEHTEELSEQALSYLSKIMASSTRMDRLINDLLNLSRLGRQELKLETLDLSEMAQEIIQTLHTNDPDREIGIRFQSPDPDCIPARADKNQMEIALTNLLANAIKFTRDVNPVMIEFGCFVEDGETIYFVRDNGAGFDMTYVDKLFTPFQRLHSEREFEGTGIGLATVQQIIQRHNGRIWVEAAVDKGATFYFTLGSVPESERREN